MKCRECIYYRMIGHTYGNCKVFDTCIVRFDESCKSFRGLDNREYEEKGVGVQV